MSEPKYTEKDVKRILDRGRKRVAPRRRLTDAEVEAALKLDPLALEQLERLSHGKASRHAQAILAAIRLRLEFTARKPSLEVEHSGGLNVTVQTLTAPVAEALPPAAPAEDPKP
jgi:hypothetical protein